MKGPLWLGALVATMAAPLACAQSDMPGMAMPATASSAPTPAPPPPPPSTSVQPRQAAHHHDGAAAASPPPGHAAAATQAAMARHDSPASIAMPMAPPGNAATVDPPAGGEHGDHAAMAAMPGMAMQATGLPPNDHVPPPAPSRPLPAMDMARMADAMQMDDRAWRGMWLLDRLERNRDADGGYATTWETEGWYGSDTNRLWLRSEGERSAAGVRDGRVELLWGHAYATFWDWQLGLRQDIGPAAGRQWLAAGVQGLAPYWFELQATAYLSQQGRLALRLEASRDLRLSQRLILAPQLELALYNQADRARQQPVGLAEAQLGLRLRYQINRQLAPYLGVQWQREGGADAPAQPWQASGHRYETRVVLGIRLWL